MFLVFSLLPGIGWPVSLAVTVWLSGVVVNWKFTPSSGGVDVRTCLLLISHEKFGLGQKLVWNKCFIRVLNFYGWSQPRKYCIF